MFILRFLGHTAPFSSFYDTLLKKVVVARPICMKFVLQRFFPFIPQRPLILSSKSTAPVVPSREMIFPV